MARLFAARTALLWSLLALGACTDDPPLGSADDAGGGETDARADEDAATRPDGGEPLDPEDAGDEADARTQPDGAACKTACETGDCETVPDGCNGFIDCDPCATGEVCGLTEANKCGVPPSSCSPLSPEQACAGKCGSVSNDCDDVIVCTPDNGGIECTADQLCGGYTGHLAANTCVDKPTCTPKTCADLGLACGVTGDDCGGTLDCTALLGGCGAGRTCGTGANYGQCEDETPVVTCQPRTPAAACAGTCGVVSDGCNGNIDCNTTGFACPSGQTCGGGLMPGVCGSGPSCTPTARATACAGTCGQVSDGCEGVYACNAGNGGVSCSPSQECIQGQCVSSQSCTPRSAAQACPGSGGHKSCGIQSDLCGGTIDCNGCPTDEQCGLGGPSLCGSSTPVCSPIPAATACAQKCGTVPDGCGGTYSCGSSNGGVSCTGSEYCGATAPNRCGAPPITCAPKTCAQLGHGCGLASDGCGHTINCWPGCATTSTTCTGTCADTGACLTNTSGAQQCVAGAPACTGSLCGSVPTSCGSGAPTRLTGTVRTPGVGNANKLPVPNALVYIPADPAAELPAIFEGVSASNTASCGRCEDEQLVAAGQSVLAAGVTDYKGEFQLEGRIPVGVAFELVVKVGKWRRVVQVPAGVSQSCVTRALDETYTRLPATSTDGLSGTRLPKVAISTGAVDAMECVFRKLGFADTEFTSPTGNGRLHLYRASGDQANNNNGGGALPTSGVTCNGSYRDSGNVTRACTYRGQANNQGVFPLPENNGCYEHYTGCTFSNDDTLLYNTLATINAYDLVVFDCEGFAHGHGATGNANIISYTNNGGRMFASHFAYTFLEGNGTLAQSATWGASGSEGSGKGRISLPTGSTARTRANPVKSVLFRNWLSYQGALDGTVAEQLVITDPPTFTITDPRDRAGANVGTSTDEWVYRFTATEVGNQTPKNYTTAPRVQQLSFNTPYAAASDQICGRVAYSGFHVSGGSAGGPAKFFPAICSASALTPQEKVLAFMLFDLATCVSTGDPPTPPQCTPGTTNTICPGANDACGAMNDGCGGVVDCGQCGAGFYCDGNTCRPRDCTPATCNSLGFTCGNHADGCGGVARNSQGQPGCGTCSNGQVCGFNDTPGVCGGCAQIPQATACQGKNCGSVSDGCGGIYDCGTCPDGQVCGAAGPNVCGPGSCTRIPQATACANRNCGAVSDGCGGSYICGTCVAPDTCGGGGTPNLCGHPTCTPLTRTNACAGLTCGWVSDGCGGGINCGTCPNGGVCGGAGPNQCGASCTPTSCTTQGAECGAIADRCGGLLDCGVCPTGQTCGSAGANKCGTATCTPRNCSQAGAACGLTGDGCGGVLNCGACSSPSSCGGAGVANQCGVGSGGCNPLTCGGQSVQCGQATDGCGGLLDCGSCGSGFTCEQGHCQEVLH